MSEIQADTQPVESYEALLEAIETLTRHEDLPTLFHELAPRLKRVVPFDFISVILYDSALQMMCLHILESDRPIDTAMGPDHPPAESPGGLVWQSQEPMIISDYEAEKLPAHDADLASLRHEIGILPAADDATTSPGLD